MAEEEGDDEEQGSPEEGPTEAEDTSDTDKKAKPPEGYISLLAACALGCFCCCCVLVVIVLSIVLAGWKYSQQFKKDVQLDEFEYGKWATVSDVSECSGVVRDVFKKGGRLADAAVTTLLCMGVAAPHLMGIGGGFIALHYNQKTGVIRALNALGRSPSKWRYLLTSETKRGSRAYIVPGALRGYEALHKNLGGNFTWKQLFEPAIKLAIGGFRVKKHFVDILNRHRYEVNLSSELQPMFENITKEGDRLVQRQLARRLTVISQTNAADFYAKSAVDFAANSAEITIDDLMNYHVQWTEAVVQDTFEDDQFFIAPFPSSGALVTPGIDKPNLAFTDQFRLYKNAPREASDKVQGLKKRMKQVLAVIPELGDGAGDPGFAALGQAVRDRIASKADTASPMYPVVPDYGGVHLSIVNEEGALSIVSGLNEPFGSKMAPVAGIIMNNYMSAFAMPSSDGIPKPNVLKENAQPRTSLNPIMAKRRTDNMLRLAAGAGGGLNGMWAMAQVLTCLSTSEASSCVRQAYRIAPEFRNIDFAEDIQPTASGIFAKSPFVSWVAPSDNEHCDGSSDGGEVTVQEKIDVINQE